MTDRASDGRRQQLNKLVFSEHFVRLHCLLSNDTASVAAVETHQFRCPFRRPLHLETKQYTAPMTDTTCRSPRKVHGQQ